MVHDSWAWYIPALGSNPGMQKTRDIVYAFGLFTFHFTGAGVFGVEMFLLADGSLLLNEIAPRPHNSGHYTIEACATSQYEQHLRAIMGWPLGDTSLVVGSR
jgi:phosphoribosylaminoimidazole carboxylase (NCAIR synthetase)